MKRSKKFLSAFLIFSLMMALAACGSSGSSGNNSGGKKVLTVSVDSSSANIGYVKYVNSIKGKFAKENNVTVKVVKKPWLDQLTALSLDGPAGKAPGCHVCSL